MIRNVVFDMGGVLIEWDPDRIAAFQGTGDEGTRLLRREVFGCREWVALDRGTMEPEEALERIGRRLPPSLHAAAERCVRRWWKDVFLPIEGMDALVREIRDLGFGVYLLSNASRDLHEYWRRLPGGDCFRGILVSADWGLLKPQHEIFEKFFSLYGLTPGECFFIDDNPLNVDGAWCVGMPGTVFFKDLARLRRELSEAGIPVQPAPSAI